LILGLIHLRWLLVASAQKKNTHLFSFALIATLRSPKKRSLLGVNEHFEGEHNDKVALLDSFFFVYITAPNSLFRGYSTHFLIFYYLCNLNIKLFRLC
ncbi:MAG: hypothetical protein IJ348_07765, partial [Alistipes sp.]|nr:hypothetical protein [Alistipes sp.]